MCGSSGERPLFHVKDVELIVLFSEQGLKLGVLLGFLVGHQLESWGNAFFSPLTTVCVILCPIRTDDFGPSWLLGGHRKSS